LLDAIFWKLATGQPWHALPFGFPPMPLCRKYYRRLFLSGRLYTLLLALYNHLRLEASIDIPGLLEAGVFTTTPSQKIALSPDASPTWENYTALLFMQLARSAYTRKQRQVKKANPLSTLLPDFKGTSALSTGELPAHELNRSASIEVEEPGLASPLSKCGLTFGPVPARAEGPGEGCQSFESSLAWKKWRKIERDQKIMSQGVSKRLRAAKITVPDDPVSSFLDKDLEP
jgi:hypothetical protein